MPLQPTIGHLHKGSSRHAQWLEIFGTDQVPLLSPLPIVAESPVGPTSFYQVDVSKLDEEVVERVINHVAEEFGEPREAVAEGIRGEHGLPILATDVFVTFDVRLVL